MAKKYDSISPALQEFIEAQKVFFVGTAMREGRINVSPKGMDTLRVVGPNRVVWLNLTGSGNETAGHIKRQNRITLMFCAFEGDALILRVYGQASILHPRDAGWQEALADFPQMAGSRQIFDVTIDSVQTSCGTGVPRMSFDGERVDEELLPYYADMGPEGVEAYWRKKNTSTIDGFETGLFED